MDPSIVNFLNQQGQPSDYASRARLAASKGITGYVGSAQQNTQLLNMLRGGGAAPAQAPAPQAAAPQQQFSQPAAQPSAPTQIRGDAEARAAGYGDFADYQLKTARKQEASSQSFSQAFNQPSINLPELYEGLYASSGIKDIEGELSAKSKAYTEQVAKIKDNPYLSEATMTGRLSKLQERFNDDTQNLRNDIAMRKADIETKLNLETKQFDIQSQQSQLAWQQFNSLLSAGALDNASGEDIATITRSTGIPSSMIQSAIDVSKKSKEKAPNTQLIQVDDGTNISAVVINQETGEVINSQVISASKPTKSSGGGESKTEIKAQETQQNKENLKTEIKARKTLQDLVEYWSQVLSIDEIYSLYNTYSPYGKAKESLAQVKQGIFRNTKGFEVE